MRGGLRMILSFLMLICIGGGIAGGFYLIRYLEKMQFEGEGGRQAFVELEEINISIIRNNFPAEIRTYKLTIETREGGPLKVVLESRPRLKDIYINIMSSLATRAGPENLDNSEYLRGLMVQQSNELLSPGAVRDIFIRTLTVRPVES